MAIYEVRVTKTIEAIDTATLCIRAKSKKEARKKAMRLIKRSIDQYFSMSTDAHFSSEVDHLDFVPDCEVL